MRNVVLKNADIEIVINTHGAELQSIKKGGREYLRQGDSDVWSGRAPVLFPICGGLKDGRFTLNDQKYRMNKHGFAKDLDFKLETQTNDKAVFLLTDSEETLVSYPFRFEFRVVFSILSSSITVTYSVKNKSEETMYFSCGAHEAFSLPDGINNASVIFEIPETLNSFGVESGLLSDKYETVLENDRVLHLKEEFFAKDALIFKKIESRSVTLSSASDTRKIKVEFEDFDHLLLWQIPGADYLCIEPWSGLPDRFDKTDLEFSNKESITALDVGKSCAFTHKITIQE